MVAQLEMAARKKGVLGGSRVSRLLRGTPETVKTFARTHSADLMAEVNATSSTLLREIIRTSTDPNRRDAATRVLDKRIGRAKTAIQAALYESFDLRGRTKLEDAVKSIERNLLSQSLAKTPVTVRPENMVGRGAYGDWM